MAPARRPASPIIPTPVPCAPRLPRFQLDPDDPSHIVEVTPPPEILERCHRRWVLLMRRILELLDDAHRHRILLALQEHELAGPAVTLARDAHGRQGSTEALEPVGQLFDIVPTDPILQRVERFAAATRFGGEHGYRGRRGRRGRDPLVWRLLAAYRAAHAYERERAAQFGRRVRGETVTQRALARVAGHFGFTGGEESAQQAVTRARRQYPTIRAQIDGYPPSACWLIGFGEAGPWPGGR
jgi:hypothetical protein